MSGDTVLIERKLQNGANTYQITGHGSLAAQYGGEAQFNCTVSPPTGVLQVTWHRPSTDERIENLATFSKHFGEQVNEPYKGKVAFKERSLNSSSILLRNITWEDEGCYICAFNVYPDGSKRKQMCLTVQGISRVNTSHDHSNEQEGKARQEVFSCSATGRPTPSIDWDVSPGATVTLTSSKLNMNGDNTITNSSSITVHVPAEWTGHVDCLLNKDKLGERRETLFLSTHLEEIKDRGEHKMVAVIIPLIAIVCIIVAAVVIRGRLKKKQRREYIT
ncbi:OX-2 membrane glycoprotein-like [Nematolebias whitei]|uniref:OX-2 membrane glycoprotein-like n=1 Tax=Nematolebias whitei TaxID=451745 RepID=UPI001897939D|nr:OX-2 membrane glycoprotein-like [Nematolebias whitei]